MALDKLVDSTQLDTDLTSVANAIRTKGGTSAQLAFPAGFVSAIGAIPTGGAPNIDDFSGGNILAIIGTGTQYIDTGYLPAFSGVFCMKLADSQRTRYQHYWGATADSANVDRIGMQVNNGIQCFIPSSSLIASNYPGWSNGDVITPVCGFSTSLTATSDLYFFRGYYNKALESSVAKYAFYGFNIMDTDFAWVKKYRPWLENGVACVKELISGTILYNSGTGSFNYIDLEGVTHNA